MIKTTEDFKQAAIELSSKGASFNQEFEKFLKLFTQISAVLPHLGMTMDYDDIKDIKDVIDLSIGLHAEYLDRLRSTSSVLGKFMLSFIEASTSGYVYLMKEHMGGLYKIGYSIDPEKRLSSINTLPYDVVELVHKIPTNNHEYLERDFHQWFSHKRVKGEWFELDEKDIEFIKSHERMYYYDTIRIDST